MRKLLALILVISMLISCGILSSVQGYASSDYIDPADIVNTYPELTEEIRNGLRNLKDEIDISKYEIHKDNIGDIFSGIDFETPDLFYVNIHRIKYTIYSSGIVAKIKPIYMFEKTEIPSMIETLNKRVDEILSQIDDNWTDEQKCRYIHDTIAAECEYNLATDSASDLYSTTVYGALIKKKVICEGYTETLNYLLGKVGIEAHYVMSPTINHAWSMVKLNGKYYHIDLTWDDPTYDLAGHVEHDFYLISDQKLKELDPDRDWKTTMKATDTTYDSYWWNNACSPIYIVDGKTYFIEEGYADDKGSFISYDENTGEKITLKHFSYYWLFGEQHWKNCYSGLAYDGDLFYLNSPDKIFSIEKDGTNLTERFVNTKDGYDIYGFNRQDNKFTIEYRNDARIDGFTEEITIEKIGDLDANKRLTINDATLIQKYLAKYNNFTNSEKQSADFNGDKNISIKDVTAMQIYLLK